LERIDALKAQDLAELSELSTAEGFRFIEGLASDSAGGAPTFEAPGAFGYAWYLGDKLVAVGGMTLDPYVSEKEGRVRRVYVHPEHRGTGLGRRLLEAILEEGRATYTLFTLRAATPEAEALYLSLGFQPSSLPETTHEMRLLQEPR